MTENTPISIKVTESGTGPSIRNASSSFLSETSTLAPTLDFRQTDSGKRVMDGHINSEHQQGGSGMRSLAQFSFAPATQTTVVTTTTTTTTTFPPLIINPPRATRDRDSRQYPLASSPTPNSLKTIKFRLGEKWVVFNEPEDTDAALKELGEQQDVLRASNGVVPDTSIQTRASGDSTRQPTRLHGNPRRRHISPISIPEPSRCIQRTRSTRLASQPIPRHMSSHSTTKPTFPGLATPETEHTLLGLCDAAKPRRRIQSADHTRREPLLRSPLSVEVHRHGSAQELRPTSERRTESPDVTDLKFSKSSLDERRMESVIQQDDLDGEELVPAYPEPGNETGDSQAHLGDEESQTSATEDGLVHDMCLPSPSLSPVAALTANADSFDSTEDLPADTDSSFDSSSLQFPPLTRTKERRDGSVTENRAASRQTPTFPTSLMDVPAVLDYFESVPDELKTYLMYQFLKRCPKSTLRLVNEVVHPALKCDFLSRLPLELSLNIVKYFDVQTMCRAAQVSKRWRQIINSDEKTWKELFDQAGFVLPQGEMMRAIREGWGWQFPCGPGECEIDLNTSGVTHDSCGVGSPLRSSLPSRANTGDELSLAMASSSRRPKRKAASRVSSRKLAKRKISTSGTDASASPDWICQVAASEGPYAAANAAAAAVPYPDVGLSSLRSLHLYKSLYQRHHAISQAWMQSNAKPKHIAFQAHGRHVVTCLQFDTDKILTGSDDTNIHVYDTQTGALKATLKGHEGGVWALEYHGNTLVSGSTDRSVRVWDIESAKCTQVFQGHTSTVRCLQIVLPAKIRKPNGTVEMMPQEPLIITGSRDSSLRVWKLPQPGEPSYFQRIAGAEDPDCPYFVRTLQGHLHSVRAIAAHGDTLVSGSYDCTVRVWKISNGETVHRLQGHSLKVYSVVLDHIRNRCISGSMDNTVKIWSLDTGSLLFNLEGHTSLVGLLDLKYDRLVSAAADSTLRIWDPDTGRCKSMLSAHTGAITCFQHDGHKVVSGSDRTLKMWDVRTGECVRDLLTDLSGVWQVRFNHRRCVAAVQRDQATYIEVLDFGAARDGVPDSQLGRRIVVNRRGREVVPNAEGLDETPAAED